MALINQSTYWKKGQLVMRRREMIQELALVLEDQQPENLHVKVLVVGQKPQKKLWTPHRPGSKIEIVEP